MFTVCLHRSGVCGSNIGIFLQSLLHLLPEGECGQGAPLQQPQALWKPPGTLTHPRRWRTRTGLQLGNNCCCLFDRNIIRSINGDLQNPQQLRRTDQNLPPGWKIYCSVFQPECVKIVIVCLKAVKQFQVCRLIHCICQIVIILTSKHTKICRKIYLFVFLLFHCFVWPFRFKVWCIDP